MGSLVKIRRVKKSDIRIIYKIGRSTSAFEVSKRIKFFTLNELKEFLTKKECILLIAEVKNKIVGFVIAFIMSHSWIYIDNFYVLPKFRHHRIASGLEGEVIKIAKKKKIDYISTIVKTSHHVERKFFRKKGYKETSKFSWLEKSI